MVSVTDQPGGESPDEMMMSIKEFREFGYLQEVNRRLLHPLGLALMVSTDEAGTEYISGVLDARTDPAGIIFDRSLMNEYKTLRVDGELAHRGEARADEYGWIVQPPPSKSDPW